MKKSEMRKVIMDAFEHEGLGTQMREKDAAAILNALEKAGMLPPFTDELCEDIGDKDYFTLHVGGAAYRSLCEWEKE